MTTSGDLPGDGKGAPSDSTPAASRRSGPTPQSAARLAVMWTGAFTVTVVVGALMFVSTWFGGFEINSTTALSLDALKLVTGIGSWIVLSSWMMTIRDALAPKVDDLPPTWQIWASWLIPIYAWFGPFIAMRKLTVGVELGNFRARWWASFVFANMMILQSSYFPGTSLALIGFIASAISLTASYMVLRVIIERTTESLS